MYSYKVTHKRVFTAGHLRGITYPVEIKLGSISAAISYAKSVGVNKHKEFIDKEIEIQEVKKSTHIFQLPKNPLR